MIVHYSPEKIEIKKSILDLLIKCIISAQTELRLKTNNLPGVVIGGPVEGKHNKVTTDEVMSRQMKHLLNIT